MLCYGAGMANEFTFVELLLDLTARNDRVKRAGAFEITTERGAVYRRAAGEETWREAHVDEFVRDFERHLQAVL